MENARLNPTRDWDHIMRSSRDGCGCCKFLINTMESAIDKRFATDLMVPFDPKIGLCTVRSAYGIELHIPSTPQQTVSGFRFEPYVLRSM